MIPIQKRLLEVMLGTVVFNEVPKKRLCVARKKDAAENTS